MLKHTNLTLPSFPAALGFAGASWYKQHVFHMFHLQKDAALTMPRQLWKHQQTPLPVAKLIMDEHCSPKQRVTTGCHALPLRLPLRFGACEHIYFVIMTMFPSSCGL